LFPVRGQMSSQSYHYGVERCFDNDTGTSCGTNKENAPWVALEFEGLVDVLIVKVIPGWWSVTNLSISVTDELPENGSEMFNKGFLLGTFRGPSEWGVPIFMSGEARGSYLLLQMDNNDELWLEEIEVYGAARETGKNL